jgi:hypothetical protein
MPGLNESRATDLGISSVKDNDERGVLRSIDFLTERGTEYINKGLEPDAKKAVISIRDIGSAAVLQKMEIGVFLCLFSLGKMAEAAREQKMSDTGLSILYSFCAIGKAAVNQRMEVGVRIAVAYMGKIINSASFQKMERETLAAALAIGSIGKETFRQQSIRVPENGGISSSVSGMFLFSSVDKGTAIGSEEFPDILSLLVQKKEEIDYLKHQPVLLENEFSYSDFNSLENALIKASDSLDAVILETKDKFLVSHMIMTKLALETLNGSEFIHEGESLD